MFDPTTLVGFHTWLSLIALAIGLVVVGDLIRDRERAGLTTSFLVTAVATSVTGFPLPAPGLLPSHIVGVIALIALALAIAARHSFAFSGHWRWVYAVTMVASVYFLAFVAVVQSFLKIPALKALAPNGSEPPFAVTQGLLLVAFVALGFLAVRAFRPLASPKAFA